MPSILRTPTLVVLTALVLLFSASHGAAQVPTREKPVMQNTFFNVIWGSVVGAMLGASSAGVSQGTKANSTLLRESVVTGATAGGIIGLGVGIWLTFSGITFDADRSLLFQPISSTGSGDSGGMLAQRYTPPIEIETAPGEPFRIIGARALILDLRF